MGGYMGLLIGASALTIFEMLDFVFSLFIRKVTNRWLCCPKKVAAVNVQECPI